MKYVRNLEDLKRYTFEFFDSFLPQDLSDQMVNYFLLDLKENPNLDQSVEDVIMSKGIEEKDVAEFGEVILQLNDYKSILKKFVELLLKAKSYEQLCAFLNRIFLQQIGDAKYRSTRKEYSINEHYFDRFVEITLYCQIDKKLYTPFFLSIFNCDVNSKMYEYKEPLKEYLDFFLKDGEDEAFINELLSTENKNGFNEIAKKNTLKTLKTLLQGYVNGEITNSALIKKALVEHKQESFNIIEALLNNDDEEIKVKACQLLLFLYDDRSVKDRIKYLYENTTSTRIKNLIEKECNLNSLKKFNSKEEFLNFVDLSVDKIQERLYGARLTRYYKKYHLDNANINGKILTFIMQTFKDRETDSQFTYLKEFFRFVDQDILSNLCNVVYEVAVYRDRLAGSKWALRLLAMFGDKNLFNHLTRELRNWFLEKKTVSVGRYFLELMAECAKTEIIDVVKSLLLANLDKKQVKFLENKLSEFSKTNKQNLEEVKDKITEDFGFDSNGHKTIELDSGRILQIQIASDCSLKLVNIKTNKPARIKGDTLYLDCNLKAYLKFLEKEIKKQKKRLYASFIEFRNYSTKTFEECIIKNNLLNYLSQRVVFARYKKDKFAEACLLKDNKLEHIYGNYIYENFDDYTIALLQPIDCADFKESLKDSLNIDELFNQIDFPVFVPDNLTLNANYVENLNGVFCNAQLFITRLQKLKYRINDLDTRHQYSTLVKENKNLNLLTTVEFDKVTLGQENQRSTTVSKIRFYDLNKQTKAGKTFNLVKTEAKTIKDINQRVLSNEVAQIIIACKS